MKLTWQYQQLSTKQRIAISLAISALLLAAILALGVPLGRDFKGGSLVMVRGQELTPSASEIDSRTERYLGMNVEVALVENGFDIEMDALDATGQNNVILMLLGEFGVSSDFVTFAAMGPTITSSQRELVLFSIIGALVGVGVISLLIFKRRVAPMVILLVLGFDILGVFGYIALLRASFGLPAVVGIAVLIGYVVNTNMLLVWRVLKRVGGEPKEQISGALNTGLLMNLMMIVLLLSLNVLTSAYELNVLTAVLVFGIAINVINMWFIGAGILLRHVERRRVKEYHVSV